MYIVSAIFFEVQCIWRPPIPGYAHDRDFQISQGSVGNLFLRWGWESGPVPHENVTYEPLACSCSGVHLPSIVKVCTNFLAQC